MGGACRSAIDRSDFDGVAKLSVQFGAAGRRATRIGESNGLGEFTESAITPVQMDSRRGRFSHGGLTTFE
jgi:hypothetical protein